MFSDFASLWVYFVNKRAGVLDLMFTRLLVAACNYMFLLLIAFKLLRV